MQTISVVAIITGLTAAISWGFSDFFAAKASKHMNPLLVTLFVLIIGAISFTLIYIFALDHHHPWIREGVIFSAGAGLLMTLSLTAFYKGLSIGPVSIVSPIGAAYPLVTTLLVIFFVRITLKPYELFGIVLTVRS